MVKTDGIGNLKVNSFNIQQEISLDDENSNQHNSGISIELSKTFEQTVDEETVNLTEQKNFSIKSDDYGISLQSSRDFINEYSVVKNSTTSFLVAPEAIQINGKINVDNYSTFAGSAVENDPAMGNFVDKYIVGTKSGFFIKYDEKFYLNVQNFKILGKGNGNKTFKQNNGYDYLEYKGVDVFQNTAVSYSADGSLSVGMRTVGIQDGVIDPTDSKVLSIVSSSKILGYDSTGITNTNLEDAVLDIKNPWYISSRLLRVLPKKLSDIKIDLSQDKSDISPYLSGSIGLSTNYFTKSEDDNAQDGFITPVIWDEDTDDSSQARPLGLPYIPADKKDALLDTTNIPTGTQSFDVSDQKPCWWNGETWDKPVLEGKNTELSTDQTYTYLGADFILLGRSSSWTTPAWVTISKGAIDPKTSKGAGLQYWDDTTLTWTVPKTGVLTLNYNFNFNNNAGTGIDGTIFQENDELWIAADKQGLKGIPSNVMKHSLTPYQFESNGKTLYKPSLYLNGSLSMSVTKGDKIQFKAAWYPRQILTSTNWDQRIQISPASFTFFVS